MRERPILFSAPMVTALLEGRKTQTRRIVKPQPTFEDREDYRGLITDAHWMSKKFNGLLLPKRSDMWMHCPYGQPGDRLWVRESWTSGYRDGCWGTILRADGLFVQGKRQHEKGPHFHAKEIGTHVRWRPSIFMPRWASRITLEITEVRVQRLQDISKEDAKAEGIEAWSTSANPALWKFQCLWDSINGNTHPWDSNPWVWALTFKRIPQ